MTTTQVNGIVLAAGLGTRLRPITGTVPKPMVPVCNRPLLGNILINLRHGGIGRVAVNTHYIADKVHDYVNSSFADFVELFHEEDILGTGGPLVNAKELLCETEHFVLHNGDILTDLDIQHLVDAHIESGNTVTMVMIDGPENKVRVTEDGAVVDIIGKLGADESKGELYTYGGISIYSTAIFDYLPDTPQNCSIITAILDLMRDKPGAVGTYIPENLYWNDLGTIKQYYKAHQDILKDGLIQLPELEIVQCQPDPCVQMSFTGFTSVGDSCQIAPNSSLIDSILLDGAVVNDGEYHRKEIIGPDFCIHADIEKIRKVSILDDADTYQISSLVEQGSDRQFYRLSKDSATNVLMISHENDADFQRFLDIGEFFCKIGVPAPFIHGCDLDSYAVLMDDMGQNTLYDLVVNSNDEECVETLYKKVIRLSALLHTEGTKRLDECENSIRIFDYDYLRWETSYFAQNFLVNYCSVSEEQVAELEPFFHSLAESVLAQPQVLMHRDFQSQNIVVDGDEIGFVDFQGARVGGIGYDAMSLINDPYVGLSKELRVNLKRYYCEELNSFDVQISSDEFDMACVTAGLQRAMQALGAYTFLSMQKGKTNYLEFIPQCFEFLLELLEEYCDLYENTQAEFLMEILLSVKAKCGDRK